MKEIITKVENVLTKMGLNPNEAQTENEGQWNIAKDENTEVMIDVWEEENYPMDPPDPIEAIKFRMEQQGLTRKDLEGIIGSRARIAEVLDRKRGLSIAMIRRLHVELNIPAEILIKPSTKRAA